MKSSLLKEMNCNKLKIRVYETNENMSKAAAKEAAETIITSIDNKGIANVMLSTGNSQLSFLKELREFKGIRWSAVNIFHLDEYIGLSLEHPASFLFYLKKNFLSFVNIYAFFPIPGQSQNIEYACKGYEYLLKAHPIDVVFIGIGENGHLAFNEPSIANFDDPTWVKIVKLDENSRQQQVGEGYFKSVKDVPTHAISVTITGMLASKKILCIVPEKRKAEAIYKTLNNPINVSCPATILQVTENATLFLDLDSASQIL